MDIEDYQMENPSPCYPMSYARAACEVEESSHLAMRAIHEARAGEWRTGCEIALFIRNTLWDMIGI